MLDRMLNTGGRGTWVLLGVSSPEWLPDGKRMEKTMKCLRCGYCCIHYDVMIVVSTDPDLDFGALQEGDVMHKPAGVHCPHLSMIDGEASCAIHDFDWYELTPCARHSQIGGDTCRIGEGIRSGVIKL